MSRRKDEERTNGNELYSSMFHYHTSIRVFSPDLQPIAGNFTTPGHCHLRVVQRGQHTIVIATEVPTNQGKSVTNAIDHIATLAVQQFELDPGKTTFIEHYTPESYEGAPREETFDLVTFTWNDKAAGNPHWQRLKPGDIEAIGREREQKIDP